MRNLWWRGGICGFRGPSAKIRERTSYCPSENPPGGRSGARLSLRRVEVQEVYPYLRVHSAAEAIDFYSRAFDAKEQFRLTEPSGRIGHAEILRP